MDIHAVRQQLRTKSIYDIPLRVTYYARVSSESDEHLNSLENQIRYYEDLIRKNRAWTFVPGYIDEGLSGISTKKRENFTRMVEEAVEDRFDLVITKDISRFARNTLDSIQYTRQLLELAIADNQQAFARTIALKEMLQRLQLLVVAITIPLGILLVYLIRQVLEPMRQMALASQEIASGNL